MPTLLDIRKQGDPILKKVSKEVGDVNAPHVQTLIKIMKDTCDAARGVGIAAPQVGHSLRIIIISSRPIPAYPTARNVEIMTLINPVIISTSEKMVSGWEACLSFPGWRAMVPRHQSVTVTFTNEMGEQEEQIFEGFLGRVCEHELDHLEGVMFQERADPNYLYSESAYTKLMNPMDSFWF